MCVQQLHRPGVMCCRLHTLILGMEVVPGKCIAKSMQLCTSVTGLLGGIAAMHLALVPRTATDVTGHCRRCW